MSLKQLYSFEIFKEIESDEVTDSVDEKGEKIKVIKKIKKLVPTQFFIRKPNRSLLEQAEEFYSIEWSGAVKRGLLTRSQLAAKFSDEGDITSRADKKTINNYWEDYIKTETELKPIRDKKEEERIDEEKAKFQELTNKIAKIKSDIQRYELSEANIFENCAEARARNKTIMWWVLHLSYFGDEKPFFGDGDFMTRLGKYDEIIENNDLFLQKVIRNFLALIGFWYVGRAVEAKDFDDVLRELEVSTSE